MKKKRIKADNVEQLIEIIRSLKDEENGEEKNQDRFGYSKTPAEGERVEESSSPEKPDTLHTPETEAESPGEYTGRIHTYGSRSPVSKELEDWDDDDLFEKYLEEDEQRSLVSSESAGKMLHPLTEALGGILGKGRELLAGIKDRRKNQGKKSRESDEMPGLTKRSEEGDSSAGETESETEAGAALKRILKTGASEKTEASGGSAALKKTEPSGEWVALENTDIPGEPGKPEEEGAGSSQQPTERENRRNPEEAQASEASAKEEDTGKKKTSLTLRKELWEPERFSPLSRIKERLWALSGLLHQKGIGKRERILIGTGALLAVIFVILIGRLAGNALERSRKSQNVTADSGLTVTVEEQPEEWCSSAQITLGVSAGDTPVTQVIIDGETYEPDENGQIRFTAEDYLVDAQAVTADGSLNARIEIPMIDWDPPSVTASLVEDQIEITAQDARSAVDKIYYAAVRPGEFLSIPYYQEYTQPFAYESGMVYYFYAQDQAGNKSIPCSTTMEKAESLVLNETELNLFIGDSVSLGVTAQPEGALLEHLTFESMNPELLEVSENGKVTALAAGTGAVRVQADGVESAVCTVDVQEERTVTITALGDCTLGTDENFNTSTSFNAFDTVNGHSYFFQNVRDILENDDATFANLEGTLTTETARESKEYAFKGDPSYTEILTDGSIEVVTLANNHSSDYGAQSLTDTETYLSEAGIDYCTGDTIAVQELNGVRTAFIGIYVLADGMGREEQVRQTIAQAQEQGAQLIVMAFHWGSEKQTAPDETQQSLAHIAVDCGADLVVGHHPHVLQGIEKYNGKYIVYSLGNFCFGGNSAPSDMDTIIFRQTFTIDEGEVQSDDQVEIIPCSISSVSGYNNYQPTPASGSEADRIMTKLNEYCAAFGTSFEASDGLS